MTITSGLAVQSLESQPNSLRGDARLMNQNSYQPGLGIDSSLEGAIQKSTNTLRYQTSRVRAVRERAGVSTEYLKATEETMLFGLVGVEAPTTD